MREWSRVVIVALACIASTAGLARGDKFWAVNVSGDFDDDNNWSNTDGGAPPATDPDITQGTFYKKSGASPYTVNFTASDASNTVTIENNRVTFDVNSF